MRKGLKVSLYVVGGIIVVPAVLLFLLIVILKFIPTNSKSNDIENEWSVVAFHDEFGSPTGKYGIKGSFEGYFDNSATTHSPLTVDIFIDCDSTVRLNFWEYNRHLSKSETFFCINGYDGTGKDYYLEEKEYNAINSQGDFFDKNRLIHDNNNFKYLYDKGILWEMLTKGGVAKFNIQVGEHTTTRYVFKVNTKGLDEALDKLYSLSNH